MAGPAEPVAAFLRCETQAEALARALVLAQACSASRVEAETELQTLRTAWKLKQQRTLDSFISRKKDAQRNAKALHKRELAPGVDLGPTAREIWDKQHVAADALLQWIAEPAGTRERPAVTLGSSRKITQ